MRRFRTYIAIPVLVVSIVAGYHAAAFARGGVLNSPHNLSASGGRGAHNIAYDEIRVCVFCHTPHNAAPSTSVDAPLWNRALPPEGQAYTMYESDVFTQKVAQRPTVPTGSSWVCLSCHDGTLALNRYGGRVLSGSHGASAYVTMPGDVSASRNSNLSTDLSDDHPISFPYTEDLAIRASLVPPLSLPGSVRLDRNNNLQCTACHDPHDNEYGNFLVMNNGDPTKPDYNPTVTSPLCVACHTPSGWDSSSPHYAGSGCLNCHVTHSSPVKQYLLNAPVEQVCFNGAGCHGSGTTPSHTTPSVPMIALQKRAGGSGRAELPDRNTQNDLQTLMGQSFYRHPVGLSVTPYKANEKLPLKQPRVECVDCHNGHVAGSSAPMAGTMKKSLRKVKGISKDSPGVVEARNEFEICYKCHSGTYAYKFVGPNQPNRMIWEPDLKKCFDSQNPSFHPVGTVRRGNGRSLLSQYKTTMLTIECTDCHNSDQSRKAGGSGPNGPHGSRYEHILIARYDMPVRGAAGRVSSCSSYQSDYALCFICHSETFVLGPESGFRKGGINEHQRHVVDNCIPCFACHDPHGVPLQQGASLQGNAFLINFDKRYAADGTVPRPTYTVTGSTAGFSTGSCSVAAGCHPKASDPQHYVYSNTGH